MPKIRLFARSSSVLARALLGRTRCPQQRRVAGPDAPSTYLPAMREMTLARMPSSISHYAVSARDTAKGT
jgi:hypothetical protein